MAVALKVLPAPSADSRIVLRLFEVRFDAEVLLDHLLGVLAAFDHGEFIDGLGVVRDRTEAVHGDRDRTHAEETEGDETEGEDRGGKQELLRHQAHDRAALGNEIGDEHQDQDDQAFPEGGEVSGDQTGEDVQGRAALTGGVDDLFAVAGLGAREDLGEFRDQRAGDGPAADDDGKRQPDGDGTADGRADRPAADSLRRR